MRPLFLELDDALEGQDHLVAEGREAGGLRIEAQDLGPSLRLWSRPPALDALRNRLRDVRAAGPELVFAGSGDFHHVAPLLIERAMETSHAEDVTVVHFDNHPDWVLFDNGMHCGSWAGRAARLPGVTRLITVGVCSDDIDRPKPQGVDLDLIADGRLELYAYRAPRGAASVDLRGRSWPTIETLGESAFADLLAERIATEAVYITIDKDVLRPEDAITNWDQGGASLALLETLIQQIAQRHRLIGADIVGDWSTPRYGGGVLPALLKRGEALLDQPWRTPDRQSARTINLAANRRLLRLFTQAGS